MASISRQHRRALSRTVRIEIAFASAISVLAIAAALALANGGPGAMISDRTVRIDGQGNGHRYCEGGALAGSRAFNGVTFHLEEADDDSEHNVIERSQIHVGGQNVCDIAAVAPERDATVGKSEVER
jgi:hypothetical protein